MLSCISKTFEVPLPSGATVSVETIIYGPKVSISGEDDLWAVDYFDYSPPSVADDDTDLSDQDLDFIDSFVEHNVYCNPHNFDPGVISPDEDILDSQEVPDEYGDIQEITHLRKIAF